MREPRATLTYDQVQREFEAAPAAPRRGLGGSRRAWGPDRRAARDPRRHGRALAGGRRRQRHHAAVPAAGRPRRGGEPGRERSGGPTPDQAPPHHHRLPAHRDARHRGRARRAPPADRPRARGWCGPARRTPSRTTPSTPTSSCGSRRASTRGWRTCTACSARRVDDALLRRRAVPARQAPRHHPPGHRGDVAARPGRLRDLLEGGGRAHRDGRRHAPLPPRHRRPQLRGRAARSVRAVPLRLASPSGRRAHDRRLPPAGVPRRARPPVGRPPPAAVRPCDPTPARQSCAASRARCGSSPSTSTSATPSAASAPAAPSSEPGRVDGQTSWSCPKASPRRVDRALGHESLGRGRPRQNGAGRRTWRCGSGPTSSDARTCATPGAADPGVTPSGRGGWRGAGAAMAHAASTAHARAGDGGVGERAAHHLGERGARQQPGERLRRRPAARRAGSPCRRGGAARGRGRWRRPA